MGMGPIRMVVVIYFQFSDFKIKLLYDLCEFSGIQHLNLTSVSSTKQS